MIKRVAIVSLVLFMLVVPVSVQAAEAGTGTIEGQLVNGTVGSTGNLADIEIKLTTNLNNQESGSATAKTEVDGRFAFNNLSTDAGYTYFATFTYQEAEYTSPTVSFGQGETSTVLNIPVYDSTDSDAMLRIPTLHTVVYVGQGSLEVNQFYSFANLSDRVYIGKGEITATGKRRTIDFPLPGKAKDIQYGEGLMECCVLPGSGVGFTDTMEVFPEGRDIVYGYTVEYSGDSYTLTQQIPYPVDQYNLLVQGEGVQIASDQLSNQGPVDMGESIFNYSVAENITPGTNVVIQLSALPQAAGRGVILWAALALVLLGGGFAGVTLQRRRKSQPEAVAVTSAPRNQQRLLAELAQLDDDFEDGKITEDNYRKLRAAKKSQLVALLQNSGASGSKKSGSR